MLFYIVFLLYDAILQSTSSQICLNISPPSTCGLCSSLYYPNLPFSWFPVSFPASSCLLKDATTNYRKEVYITSLKASQSCDGTINAPYSDIFSAFYKEMQLSVNFLNVSLSFYLIGQQHYLFNNSFSENPEIYPFFRKQYANISLQPLPCQKISVNGCFSDPNAKAEIYLKSKNVVFFISNTLSLLNLEFFGFDMNLDKGFLSQNTSTHCQPRDLEILNVNQPECFLKNSSISTLATFEYGFFNLEFLPECDSCDFPRILLKNCGFHYLNQKDTVFLWSFIAIIAHSPNSIEFDTISFEKSHFQMGLVYFPYRTDLYYPYSRSSSISYYIQNRGALAEFSLEINGFNVSSYNYFGINPLMSLETNVFLFSISMDSASEIYDVAPKLHLNMGNLNFSDNLLYFSLVYASAELNPNSSIRINNATFTNNYLNYFLSLNTSIPNFTLSNSFFSNNTGLAFSTVKNTSFFFIGFHLSHHSSPVSPIFTLNSNTFSFQNSTFIDIFPQTTPTSLFSITQWSTYFSIERYEYGNYTNDNLEFKNVTFEAFANVSIVNSNLKAITTLTIVDSVFRGLTLDRNSQFFTVLIEFNFMLSHSVFYNITMHTIFQLPFSRNCTLNDIVYSNSHSNFMKITGVPGVFHRSLYDFSHLLFENITLSYSSVSETFFSLFSIYESYDFDCVFSDLHFKSLAFAALQTNLLFTAWTCSAFSLTGLIFENNSNANYFSVNQYPYTNEINLLNFSGFKFLNPAYSSDFFIQVAAVDYLELSDSLFYSGDSSNTRVAFTASCLQNCALVFKNVQIVFSQSISGSALILSYFQSFQHIAVDHCSFVNGGSFFSLQYVDSIFGFSDFDALKLGFFESALPELTFQNQSLVLLKNTVFFNFATFKNSLKTPGIRSSSFTQTTPRQTQSFSLKFGDLLLISCSFASIQGGILNILQDTSLLIYNSSFVNCSSDSSGGVLSISVAANVLISFSRFSDSLSREKGGVLYSEKSRIILFWDAFESSHAEGEGGAIYLYESIAKLEGCSFRKSNSNSKGGDIFATASYLEAFSCDFSQGYANSDGSTIYSLANYLVNFSALSIANSSNLQMGVVCIVGIENLQAFCRRISFVNNSGVALAVKEGKISLESSLFSNNYGIALMNCFSSFQRVGVEMRNSIFIGNNFSKALLTGSYADFIISSADFKANVLERSLFTLQFSHLNLSESFLSVVSAINLGSFGFLIHLTQCQISLSNASLQGNELFGGISSETSSLFLKNSVFSNCTGMKGGALSISSATGVRIENLAFLGNKADFGAAIYSIDSNLTLSAGVFLENQANYQGSCIFSLNPIEGSYTQIRITDSIFNSYNQMIYIDRSLFFLIEGSGLFCLKTHSQALYLKDLINTMISHVNISNSSSFPSLSLINEGIKPLILSILTSAFLNNSALIDGGAIYLTGAIELTLHNSLFLNNSACQNGGALYFDCPIQICSDNLYITNCTFSSNSAQRYGGAIKAPHTDNYDIVALNRFLNNSAVSGNDLSSEVLSFQCLDSQNTSIFPSMAIYPGVKFDLKCQIFDVYHQSLIFDQTGTFLISFNDSDVKASHDTTSLTSGSGYFTDLVVIALPGSVHPANVSFSTPYQTITNSLRFRFLPCKRGEIFLNLQCLICDIGYYSLSDSPYLQNKSVCDVCDPNAICPGGDKLIPKPGYWRMDENTSRVIACTTEDQCPDQTRVNHSGNLGFVCGESYYGHICANCQQGYYENGNGVCQKCENLTFYYAIFFASVIALTLFLVYQAKQALEFHEEQSKERSMLKLLINHVNYLTLLNSCDLSLSFPDQISFLIQLNHEYLSILSQNLFNIDCFLMDLVEKDNIVAGRVIFRAISPVLFFIFSLSIIIFIELFDFSKPKIPFLSRLSKILPKKKPEKKELPQIEINPQTKTSTFIFRILNFVGAAFIICTFNFYSQILINTFTMVKCMGLDESQRTFLIDDPDIECWSSPKHNYLINDVFLPNLLIWCLGWPLTLFLMLRLYKRSYMKKMEQKLMLDRKSTLGSKNNLDTVRENNVLEEKREKDNIDEEKSSKSISVTKRTPSFSSKSHFKVLLNNFTKNKRSIKDEETRPKDYSHKGTFDKIPEDLNKVERLRSTSFKKSIWRKMTSLRKTNNNKACFILSTYQEQILFNNNKVILFLTIDYKYECYYWETFFYLTNLILSILFTFSSVLGGNLNLVGAGVILMYFIMLLVTEVKRPFKYEFINNLAAFSYIVSIINVGLSMMSSVKDNTGQQNMMYLSGLIFSNVVFLTVWTVYFNIVKMKQFLPQFKTFYYFLRRKLMRHCS